MLINIKVTLEAVPGSVEQDCVISRVVSNIYHIFIDK